MHDDLKIQQKNLKVGFNLENREFFFRKTFKLTLIKSRAFNLTRPPKLFCGKFELTK